MSAWTPLRNRVYRALWIAQFTSNVGTWMQTVGAQWLMGDLGAGPLKVALVQTATSLPMFLIALPAGAMGDVFDRRRILLASQSFMLLAAAALGALTLAGLTTPWVLLALTFAVGAGNAMTMPSWQAIQPELVGIEQIPQAAALGGMSMNVARAVGPAVGGALVAAAGPEAVFLLNAASFLAVLGALAWWRRPRPETGLGPEHISAAVRAGARYVRSSPRLRAVLARASLFIVFSSSIWALLPVLARRDLSLGSGGYGLLLAAVGAGAIGGAQVLPWARSRWPVNRVVAAAGLAVAGVCAVLAWVHSVPVVALALVVAGVAWITTMSSFNATAQTSLPGWVRARGMAVYLLTFQGGQALGSLAWGVVAEHASTRAAFTAAAAGLTLGVPAARRWVLQPEGMDLRPSGHWPEPHLVIEPDPAHGPILVTVEYRVAPERQEEFRALMRRQGRGRRRTGAHRWGLYQDGSDPERFVETYVVTSWNEHVRQHERVTRHDQQVEDEVRALAEGPPSVSHLFFAYERS